MELQARAKRSSNSTSTLLNGAIDLVWSVEELSACGGLIGKNSKRPTLDAHKAEAVKGMSTE